MAEQNPDLLKQAAELNIEVTETATNEAIQAAIDEVLAEDGKDAQPDIAKIREEYHVVVGKKPFGGWDAEELRKRMDAAKSGEQPPASGTKAKPQPKAEPKQPAAALHQMVVNRDFWDENGERHRAGSIAEVTADAAIDGASTGALSRVR